MCIFEYTFIYLPSFTKERHKDGKIKFKKIRAGNEMSVLVGKNWNKMKINIILHVYMCTLVHIYILT